MGVINTTPDSFSDGGTLFEGERLNLQRCLDRARSMVAQGATILDIGGESTRPGAAAVSLQQEIDRVLPVVDAIVDELDVKISVDTSSAEVMRLSAEAGAWMINDVRALRRQGALEAAAATSCQVCLMHMQGQPSDMQEQPQYDDVVEEVRAFLLERAELCVSAGISTERLWLDPGFGFGKTLEHNLQLLAELPHLVDAGFPVLVGLSRKSMIDKILGRAVDKRLPASLGLAVLAAERGARIIRTHDVAETADAVAMVSAIEQLSENTGK